jgi:hypothetical protein
MLKEICDFILTHAAAHEGFVLGVNFFAGHLPMKDMHSAEVPVRLMVVLERTPGAVNGQLPDYVEKPIQVWNRNDNYFEARSDAEAVYAALHGYTGGVLAVGSAPRYCVLVIDAVASPAPIANPNERGEFEFSTNYVFRIEGEPPVP